MIPYEDWTKEMNDEYIDDAIKELSAYRKLATLDQVEAWAKASNEGKLLIQTGLIIGWYIGNGMVEPILNVDMFSDRAQAQAALAEQIVDNYVLITRCKDCVHHYEYDDWDKSRGKVYREHDCHILHRDFGENGFCCRGERLIKKDIL